MNNWYGIYEEGVLVDIREFTYYPEISDFRYISYDSRCEYLIKEMTIKPKDE